MSIHGTAEHGTGTKRSAECSHQTQLKCAGMSSGRSSWTAAEETDRQTRFAGQLHCSFKLKHAPKAGSGSFLVMLALHQLLMGVTRRTGGLDPTWYGLRGDSTKHRAEQEQARVIEQKPPWQRQIWVASVK